MAEPDPSQEDVDGWALCSALAVTVKKHGWSVARLSRESGIPVQNLQRMMRSQEPKYSQLCRVERTMALPLGTVVREARLIELPWTAEELIETDPRLAPLFQKYGRASFDLWVRHSADLL